MDRSSPDQQIAVHIMNSRDVGDQTAVAVVTALINSAYEIGEAGLWHPGAARTNGIEVESLIRQEKIAVAAVSGAIVGAIRFQTLNANTGEFGMLAAAPGSQGSGVGTALVAFAEDRARAVGLATMQLEVLVPQTWKHPVKEFLLGWYERIGYARVRTSSVAEFYPELAPQLATPCDFVVFQKELNNPR